MLNFLRRIKDKQYRNRDLERWCGIGIEGPRLHGNTSIMFRTAASLNASDFLFTVGPRYKDMHGDTVRSNNCQPCFNYPTVEDFAKTRPNHCVVVGVEQCSRSLPLQTFKHPKRCIYVLGSEDSGISKEMLKQCRYVVSIPSPRGLSLNVSSAASIVLWDRYIKLYGQNKNNI